MEPLHHLLNDNPVLWVFGYGSLLWKPDFCYKSKVIGYIDGFQRRFNQGNETFRGIPGKPGRVANLEEKNGSQTWGVAYEVSGQKEVSKVLQNLYVRESQCGGYTTLVTSFYPRNYCEPPKCQTTELCSDNTDCIGGQDKDCQHSKSSTETGVPLSPPSSSTFEGTSSVSIDNDSIFFPLPNLTKSGYKVSNRWTSDSFSSKNSSTAETELSDSVVSKSRLQNQVNQPTTINAVKRSSIQTFHYEGMTSSDRQTIPISAGFNSSSPSAPVQVLVYTATPDNNLYQGPDSLNNVAHQVLACKGTAGTNVEYILKIADFCRKYIPEDDDDYLFSLDHRIREELYRLINMQRASGSRNGVEKVGHDVDLEHHEALLKAVRICAS